MYDPDDRQQEAGELRSAGTEAGKWRRMVRYERADAAHVRPEGFDEFKILRKLQGGLVRRSDHHAASDLVTGIAEIPQAAHPVVIGHVLRVELRVMVSVGGLVAEKIAVSPGFKQFPVTVSAPFPE